MFTVGMNPYAGLISKTDFKRGKGMMPGSRGAVNMAGDHKEFVAIKLATTATYINGQILQIDAAGVGSAAVVATNPAATVNARLGILVFASATLTTTTIATVFGYAQIYGQCLAVVSTTVSLVGVQLVLGADPGQLINGATVASTESQVDGITAVGTQSVTGLLNVFLNYPRLRGLPDTNLA
jgi:hypothetical protein